ncbi:hypothetical protein BGX31_005518 [Mortierella sp. GBA43]|nr:hypothetical protein BGX31_005518 [Mortierella sp. GBA43]
MTAVFSTQEKTPGSYGFTAGWISVYTAGFKDFTPRSQHSMAYDPSRDIVYITGGTSSQTPFMGDVLIYSFANNRWNKLQISTKTRGPDPRYGHYSFVYNDDLHIYGGVTGSGGRADIWRLSGRQWSQRPLPNPDQLPVGRLGAACTLITTNNQTRLVVFGGLSDSGKTVRDLYMYSLEEGRWEKTAHQNSVGLSGAAAVYHKTTESIYFFGGMVNRTIRNVITYQYDIQQDAWHALAPRIDPLTSTPVIPVDGHGPSGNSTDTKDDGPDDDKENGEFETFLPPVMYDSVSTVWTPAVLADDDKVVIYGGMRPFGPGLNPLDQSCYARSVSVYDLSCQNWTTFDLSATGAALKSRVNHTMILRPPGSPGGNHNLWTLYVFGGFDGNDRQDMFNVTLNLPTADSAYVNNCRALRWCNLYDDCQNCKQNYCSYVGGLCLFDTDKASTPPPDGPPYLVGDSSDVPKNGTIQDLIRQRPKMKQQVLTVETCPSRTLLSPGVPHQGTLEPGQEVVFKTYIDAHDQDIQFEIHTTPSLSLEFKSLNVWEGYVNMFWRATHGLSDNSWDGTSGTSSPIPSDIPKVLPNNVSTTSGDRPVVTAAGILDVGELYNRWLKYSGLDGSPSTSALWMKTGTLVEFPAGDPRRFSGYYVYSVNNTNTEPVSFTLTVNLLNHHGKGDTDRGGQFDLATLAFAMIGFILGALLLILIFHKVRKMLREREQARRAAAELRMLEDEEAEEERRRQAANLPSAAGASSSDQSAKDWKPMYRVVVGVQQDVKEILGLDLYNYSDLNFSTTNILRHRHSRNGPMTATLTVPGIASGMISGLESRTSLVPPKSPRSRSHSDTVVREQQQQQQQRTGDENNEGTPRSDFICDLGSTTTESSGSRRSTSTTGAGMGTGAAVDTKPRNTFTAPGDGNAAEDAAAKDKQEDFGLELGESLNNLDLAASLRLPTDVSENNPGDQEVLKDEKDNVDIAAGGSRVGVVSHSTHPSTDSGPTVIGGTSSMETSRIEKIPLRASRYPRRNPIRVQPISVEPLTFHGALVARTKRNHRRYQRLVARQRPQVLIPTSNSNNRSRTSVFGRSTSHKSGASGQAAQVEGESVLKRAQRAALRMNLRSYGGLLTSTTTPHRDGKDGKDGIEMVRLEKTSGSRRQPSSTSFQGPMVLTGVERDPENLSELKTAKKKKGPRSYEPGPLSAVNVLIVFPGDAKTRPIMITDPLDAEDRGKAVLRDDTLYDNRRDGNVHYDISIHDWNGSNSGIASSTSESMEHEDLRLPPMAIGTILVPDPVRWWTFKTRQHVDRMQLEKDMRRRYLQQQRLQQQQQRQRVQFQEKSAEDK